jgi:hypothetical protein
MWNGFGTFRVPSQGPEGLYDPVNGDRDFTTKKPAGFFLSSRSDDLSDVGEMTVLGKNYDK